MLIEGDTLLMACLTKYGIFFVCKCIIWAEAKRNDSFPHCIDHFMQVTAEGKLRR